jgi:hypothetical protein
MPLEADNTMIYIGNVEFRTEKSAVNLGNAGSISVSIISAAAKRPISVC